MPKSKKRPGKSGKKSIVSKPMVAHRPGGFQDNVKPITGLAKGARGKPMRFPGRAGGR